jgi:hypothetical protein
MRKDMMRRQKTSYAPQVDVLERREVPSTVVNFSIPFVFAPAGARQSAISFTSITFHRVWERLNTAVRNFVRSGNVITVDAQLQAISGLVPYGRQGLLNTWLSDLDGAGRTASANTVLHQDLISYVDNNEGRAFNVLRGLVGYSTDGLLTYNGRVGHNPPTFQPKVIGVTAT